MKFSIKPLLPHLAVVLFFILINVIYFKPVFFEGKQIEQGDITNFKGMSKEIVDYREKTGDEPLWTNSMFGGMPAYQISVDWKANWIKEIPKFLRLGLPHPAGLVFLNLIGFYILMLVLRVNPWLGAFGAVAFAFSSYFFIILEAGHNSKAHAIAYIAPVLAGVILTFRGKLLLGGALTALFLGLEIAANHLQITYYLFFVLLIYGIVELIHAIKEKLYLNFIKQIGVLIIAAILALLPSFGSLWATYTYGQETIRGKSELTFNANDQTSGLDKSYATAWSYGVGETMTLLVPNFKGGGSGTMAKDHKNALKEVEAPYRQIIGTQIDKYWGDQPFTSGPVYVGAFVFFLFLLSLLVIKGRFKWAMLAITILSIVLAWGKNDDLFHLTDFFLKYFPGYNKFRAVSMILVLAEFTIPLMAVLVVKKLVEEKNSFDEKVKIPFVKEPLTVRKIYLGTFILVGGLTLFMYISPDTFTSFFKEGDQNEYESMYNQIAQNSGGQEAARFMENVETARKAIFKADVIRSFMFILLCAALIWFYAKAKFDKRYLYLTLIVFLFADMWSVNKRYINEDNFVKKAKLKVAYHPDQADLQILKDPSYFRVYSTLRRFDQDSRTSYFHKSLGGYHGAKLRRYQDLIDFHLSKGNMDVINMLNTKYVIVKGQQGGEPQAQTNPGALGPAWFVENYKLVASPDSEITALSSFDPSKTAIVDQRFQKYLDGFTGGKDSIAKMNFVSYKPNHLVYETETSQEQLAIFSEIYFADGWNAYVDGEPEEYVRANYVLRAMRIPSGKHKIEFKFEPKVYFLGEKISLAGSVLLLIAVFGALFYEFKKQSGTE